MLSDKELMLLEQLTYSRGVIDKVFVNDYNAIETYDSLNSYLAQFDEKKLKQLEKCGTIGDSYTQGKEWAAVIRAMKKNKSICNLKIKDVKTSGKKIDTILFTEGDSDKSIVAFRGTLNGEEWYDNVMGIVRSDTRGQRRAKQYIDSLPYDDITVVGHSKGGNKAQYVAITSDKVTRCISMDGQGFSKKFYEKYRAEIARKAGIITNYSLDNDFVHILMMGVPGSNQIYCKGSGMEGAPENHSPNSYFYFNEDGTLKMDGEEPYTNEVASERISLTYLRNFVVFAMNNIPEEDMEKIAPYLGNILKVLMGNETINVNGVKYDKSNLIDYIQSNPEALSIVLAALKRYSEENPLTNEILLDALDAFGIDNSKVQSIVDSRFLTGAVGVLVLIIVIIAADLGLLYLLNTHQLDNLIALIAKYKHLIDSKYDRICANEKRQSGSVNYLLPYKKLDFSEVLLQKITAIITRIGDDGFGSLSNWKSYSGEEWYSSLGIEIARHGIELYSKYLKAVNNSSKKKIAKVFNNEWHVDDRASRKIYALRETLKNTNNGYTKLAERIKP